MNALTINATEFSRGMSEFLNNLPTAAVSAGFPIAQLDDLFANNAIPTDERVRMAQDMRALRSGLASKADPWGS